ncbi:MAG TPA: histidine kinase, partial [Streptosporangiaceae bacterium]|nr:histidine kinase [Streptosporangiaceae bacterium]
MVTRVLHAPWSPRAWRQALYLAGGIPAQVVVLLPIVAWAVNHYYQQQGRLAPVTWERLWPLLLIGLALVFLALPLLTRMHRHRLRTTAGVEIPPQPVTGNRLTTADIAAYVRSPATWRQLGYHVLAAPALAAAALVAVGAWLTGALFTLVYVYSGALSERNFFRTGQTHSALLHVVRIPWDVYLTVGGVLLLLAAPWFTAAVAALDASAARALLGPSRAEELEHRVEHLTQTRTGVVDAADAERRRLERDLHDGTQQRLVSLAMRLGMARAEPGGEAQARQVIAEAHEEAKAALVDLRNLIRGLHPAVLEDRGLDAALSGVAARLPIPVRLTVDVPGRPPPTIEAVAYFVVSEGLTNIAKHAQASQAEVFVQRANDRLHIIVSDDGVGGADPARGTGLAGLAKR